MSRDEENVVRDESLKRLLTNLAGEFPPDENLPSDADLVTRNLDAVLDRRAARLQSSRAVRSAARWPRVAAITIGAFACAWVAVKVVKTAGHNEVPSSGEVPMIHAFPSAAVAATTRPFEALPSVESEVPTLDVSSLPTARAAPTVSGVASPSAASAASAPGARAMAASSAPTASSSSAAELFSAANDARRRRAMSDARRLYRELQLAYPGSAESLTSLVALGRLELDSGNARPALEQFDKYVQAGRRELREDALIGRASALESLGSRTEERRAWQALVDEYPNTLFEAHAKARIAPP